MPKIQYQKNTTNQSMTQSTTTANQEQPPTTTAKNPVHPNFNNMKKECNNHIYMNFPTHLIKTNRKGWIPRTHNPSIKN